ncbi:secreted protein containing DUF1329 [Candidatus Magnetomorum sp. HK-1]|nr:secreted protein containing DUF1329 [Candidatus Magnetomorum sp. HK-1]
MLKHYQTIIILLLFMFCITNISNAKISSDEAKKLGITGTPLTPVGAERAANKDGTIPQWNGGVIPSSETNLQKQFPNSYKVPSTYKNGNHHSCPFKESGSLFTITSENYEKYKDKLTEGMMALIKKYPKTFKMNIYETHRTASLPEWVYQASMENSIKAELVEDGNGIKGARATSPFPVPQNGVEAIWNHITHYRGLSVKKFGAQAAPSQNGDYVIMKMIETMLIPYSDPKYTTEQITKKNVLGYFLQMLTAPARLTGTALLIYDYMNQKKTPRNAWIYKTGERRVRRAPNAAYDYPGTASDGLRTTDDWDFYNGAPDRYNWKLIGKQEKYIPYNCYKIHSKDLKYKDILKPGHVNQDHVRYELHRVWIVEASLKDKSSHIYKMRRFYIDEDSWAAVAAEMYNDQNQLWRVLLAHLINYYEMPLMWSTLDVYHDLIAGRYLATNLDNETRMFDFSVKFTKKNFSSGALLRTGIR